jgi:hypothetical protein
MIDKPNKRNKQNNQDAHTDQDEASGLADGDGKSGNDNGPDGPLGLVFLPLNVIQLQELLLWCQLAVKFITVYRQETKQAIQSMMSPGLTIEITDANVTLTLERLLYFINILQETLHEIRVSLAAEEMKVMVSKGRVQ